MTLRADMRTWMSGAAAIVLSLLAIGCGGESQAVGGDEQELRALAKSYVIALGDGNFDKACGLMTDELRADWADLGLRDPRLGTSCPEVLKSLSNSRDLSRVRKEAEDFRIDSITIDGDTAVITDNQARTPSPAKKEGEKWLLDDYVDEADAARVAETWASAHQREGEQFEPVSCSAKGDWEQQLWDEFGCRVRYRPSGRGFVVYLRAVNGHTGIEVVKALPGTDHQLVPIQDDPRDEPPSARSS